MMLILLVCVTACGEADQAETVGAAQGAQPAGNSSAASLGDGVGETIAATRAEVEEAWKCRGLIAAAAAAKKVLLAGELPAALAEIDTAMTVYWDDRVGRLKAPDMSEADVDALVVNSTRNLVTRDALERELPNISACIAVQKGA
ncbi:hypothetical protein [uncultured Erythrobacter sp.]|uniref:hypothetical protein n=1 Tax=uncultured Erythrobacter sp. TaxID=263913 RepID=UPI00265AD3F0|nr:hypothetical protein [uncultured Erythrobacter sp.]